VAKLANYAAQLVHLRRLAARLPMLEEAYELHKSGRLAEAEARYREWLGFNPEDPDGLHLLAVVRRQRGAIGEALQLARQAVALRPDRATFYVTLAGIEFHARQWAAARADFETALRLDPNQTSAYSALGHIARIQGDDARAEENFKRALLTERDRADVLIGYGNLMSDRGDFANAVQYLARATKLDPDNSATQASFGRALLGNGQWAFAEQALENALRLRPDSPGTLRMLLRAQRERGDFAAAKRSLERLGELPDQASAVAEERAEIARAQGDVETAIEAYATLRALRPADRDVFHLWVAALRTGGRLEPAVAALREHLESQPDDLQGLRGLAGLLMQSGREAEALPLLRRSVELDPDNADALAALAVAHEFAGDFETAETLATRALTREPRHAAATGLLVNAALLRGDAATATTLVEQIDVTLQPPPQRVAWLGLSGCAAHLGGDRNAALAHWRAAQAARSAGRPPLLRPLDREAATGVGAGEPTSMPLVDRVPLALLLGTPGSCADLIAALLTDNGYFVLADRFRGDGRNDGFSKLEAERYVGGMSETDAKLFARQYERALDRLPLAEDARVIDWLPAWDARMSAAVKSVFGAVPLILATDDPRDALLNWLAFGARAGWPMPDPVKAAPWLANALQHLIATAQYSGLPLLAFNSSELVTEPEGCGRRIGELLGTAPLVPGARFAAEMRPPRTLAARFAPGTWREYAEPLAPAFAAFDALARDVRGAESS